MKKVSDILSRDREYVNYSPVRVSLVRDIPAGDGKINNLFTASPFISLTKLFHDFMYRRPILCTLYGAVDFLNVLKKYIMYL